MPGLRLKLPPRRSDAAFAAAALFTALFASTAPSRAQSGGCGDIQQHLVERQELVKKFQAMTGDKKKPIDARLACTALGKLTSNGAETVKWIEANKDWCQIPDQFVQNFKTDHANVGKMRSQACNVAAKQAEMEKRAKNGQAGGLLGGGGLEGTYRIPQGAL
jgi:hypothetical protein